MVGLVVTSSSARKTIKTIRFTRRRGVEQTQKALVKAALLIKSKAVPLTPIDSGNLRASCFVTWDGATSPNPTFTDQATRRVITYQELMRLQTEHPVIMDRAKQIVSKNKEKEVRAMVGYSAFYAHFVHENYLGVVFHVGGDHFLIRAVIENRNLIKKTIQETFKGKR